MVSPKVFQDAHKVTFLVSEFPDHTLGEVLALFQLPPIDINAAVWYAQERGFLSQVDDNERVTILEHPKEWYFGSTVMDLRNTIMYCFEQLAKKESDIEEVYFSKWTTGYLSHDVLIAMKQLLKNKKLFEYELMDGVNKYKFFTLYENGEQLWGQKQFKKPPKASKKIIVEGDDDPGTKIDVKKG